MELKNPDIVAALLTIASAGLVSSTDKPKVIVRNWIAMRAEVAAQATVDAEAQGEAAGREAVPITRGARRVT